MNENHCKICETPVNSRRVFCEKHAKEGYKIKRKEWNKKHPHSQYFTSATIKDLEKKEEA